MVSNLKIGGMIYDIEIVKKLEDNNQSVWGYTDFQKTKIKLRKGINEHKQ